MLKVGAGDTAAIRPKRPSMTVLSMFQCGRERPASLAPKLPFERLLHSASGL